MGQRGTLERIQRLGIILGLACAVGSWLGGCAGYYKRFKDGADRETYGIISEAGDQTGGMPAAFTVETPADARIPDAPSSGPLVVSLIEALELAVQHSRSYQTEKERLFRQGLTLSDARHRWNPLFSGSAATGVTRSGQTTSWSRAWSVGVSKMLATGADLSLSLAVDYFRIINGQAERTRTGKFAAQLTQPLLQGFGPNVALEDLTQAERNMVYAIRDFVRFRKRFSVGIAQDYFDLLRQRDQVNNLWNSYLAFKKNRERDEWMGQADRKSKLEVDRTRTSELSGRINWIRAKERYSGMLDQFRLNLGLPLDLPLEPAPAELARLTEQGLTTVTIAMDDAIAWALEERLDLKSRREEVEDAWRKIKVAESNLLPKVDLTLFYNATSEPTRKYYRFNDEDDTYGAALDAELPFDKHAQRNAYREALIAVQASERQLAGSIDTVKAEVRNLLRLLNQAEQSHRIQKARLLVADGRVENSNLLYLMGEVGSFEVEDAQNDLLGAQNDVTSALVDYYNARLDLALALETLRIDERGLWEEAKSLESGE